MKRSWLIIICSLGVLLILATLVVYIEHYTELCVHKQLDKLQAKNISMQGVDCIYPQTNEGRFVGINAVPTKDTLLVVQLLPGETILQAYLPAEGVVCYEVKNAKNKIRNFFLLYPQEATFAEKNAKITSFSLNGVRINLSFTDL